MHASASPSQEKRRRSPTRLGIAVGSWSARCVSRDHEVAAPGGRPAAPGAVGRIEPGIGWPAACTREGHGTRGAWGVTGGYTGGAVREPVFESVEGMTQAEFAVWVAGREERGDLGHYELLNGRVVMTPPAGYPHGGVGLQLGSVVAAYLAQNPVGRAFDSSQGFDLPSGDTLEPDLSVVSRERWDAGPAPEPGKFLRMVPDVVFEILSPSTRSRDRGEKKAIYERNGVREYWLLDPQARRLTRFVRVGGLWDAGTSFEQEDAAPSAVLPGLVIDLAALLAAAL